MYSSIESLFAEMTPRVNIWRAQRSKIQQPVSGAVCRHARPPERETCTRPRLDRHPRLRPHVFAPRSSHHVSSPIPFAPRFRCWRWHWSPMPAEASPLRRTCTATRCRRAPLLVWVPPAAGMITRSSSPASIPTARVSFPSVLTAASPPGSSPRERRFAASRRCLRLNGKASRLPWSRKLHCRRTVST